MSVEVARNRFIVPSLNRLVALYQRLLKNTSSIQNLGERLIYEAKKAFAFRQTEILEEIALLLSNLPNQEYQLIGQYYKGWCAYQKEENPKAIFERVAEKSQTYKAISLMSLAALEARNGDYTSEMRYFTEAVKRADSPTTLIRASKAIAVIKAKEGYHKRALQDLEDIIPLLRYVSSDVYFDSLNSLAVELGEAGRIEEAQNVCRITLASPFAFAYPEWRETGQELALRGYKSRSSVRVKLPGNLLFMPEPVAPEASDTCIQSEPSESRPVVSLEEWKEQKMVKEPNGDELKTTSDRLVAILKLVDETLTDADLDKVIDLLRQLHTKKKP